MLKTSSFEENLRALVGPANLRAASAPTQSPDSFPTSSPNPMRNSSWPGYYPSQTKPESLLPLVEAQRNSIGEIHPKKRISSSPPPGSIELSNMPGPI